MENQFNINDAVKKAVDGSIFIEPTCKYFGINYNYQKDDVIAKHDTLKLLRRNNIAADVFLDKKQHLCLEKKGYTLWILQLVPRNIGVGKEDLFKYFQTNFFEYVWSNLENNQTKMNDVHEVAYQLHVWYKEKTAIQKKINQLNLIKNKMLETSSEEWAIIRNDFLGQLELFSNVKQLNA